MSGVVQFDRDEWTSDRAALVDRIARLETEVAALRGESSEVWTSQRWLESVLRVTNTRIDIIDDDFNLHYVDPRWQDIYGPPVGRKCFAYFMGRSEPCPGCGIPRALATGDVQVTEEVLLREGGRTVEVHTIPFRNDDGLRMVAEFNLDVTARKRAEEERLALERQLLHTQKLESLGLLAGGIAHDFNNLLVAILGSLDLGLLDLPPTSPARRHLDDATLAAARAAELTQTLLAYAGRGQLVMREVQLSRVVEDNAHLLHTAVSGRVTLRLELARDLPVVTGDVGQLQQVVMNLVTNAVDAVGAGPGTVVLATGVMAADATLLAQSRVEPRPAPGTFIWVEVRDHGCGMDEVTCQRLFDPFFTTKTTGRGLGMAAVLGIVRGHRGAITVDSRAGSGTTIRVLFPAAAQAVPATIGEPPSAAT